MATHTHTHMKVLRSNSYGCEYCAIVFISHLYSSEGAVSALQPISLFVKGGHLQRPHKAALGCTFLPSALPLASSAHTINIIEGGGERKKLISKCGKDTQRHENEPYQVLHLCSILSPDW